MEKRLSNWLKKQIISDETYNILLKEIKEEAEHKRKVGLTVTFYILGIILLGLGIASFIAANDWIIDFLNRNEILKIILLFLLTVLSLYFGYKTAYVKENFVKLGKALICLSSVLIGSCYMLIGQIYNINAHSSFLMMLWCVSIVPLAYIFREKFINILATVVFIVGFVLFLAEIEINEDSIIFYVPILIGSFLYLLGGFNHINEKFHDFAVFYKLLGLKAVYITLLILTCWDLSYDLNHWQCIVPVIILMIAYLINGIVNRNKDSLYLTESIYFFLLLAGLLAIIIPEGINEIPVIIAAHIFLIIMFYYAIHYGYKYENTKIISMAHAFIGIYLFVMFCRYGWSFFDKTIFFLLSGIILITMGILFEKKRKLLKEEFYNE